MLNICNNYIFILETQYEKISIFLFSRYAICLYMYIRVFWMYLCSK
jgi:hypothetical protein